MEDENVDVVDDEDKRRSRLKLPGDGVSFGLSAEVAFCLPVEYFFFGVPSVVLGD